MKKVVVLGCGRVGAGMARDLADDPAFDVAVADLSAESLGRLAQRGDITSVPVDLSSAAAISTAVSTCDLVIGALPSRLGMTALRAVIEAGKPYCDISFMDDDALELDDLARERGVTAVVDNGVAPGLSNMIVGCVSAILDKTEWVDICVGGLPKSPQWPFQYKAPFAPSDVPLLI